MEGQIGNAVSVCPIVVVILLVLILFHDYGLFMHTGGLLER